MLVFSDQNIFPGFRHGTNFVSNKGKHIEYDEQNIVDADLLQMNKINWEMDEDGLRDVSSNEYTVISKDGDSVEIDGVYDYEYMLEVCAKMKELQEKNEQDMRDNDNSGN